MNSSKYPHKISTPAAPNECEAFQNDIFVANSLGANQCEMSRAHGG